MSPHASWIDVDTCHRMIEGTWIESMAWLALAAAAALIAGLMIGAYIGRRQQRDERHPRGLYESYHVGIDGRQHAGEWHECKLCDNPPQPIDTPDDLEQLLRNAQDRLR